MSTGGKYDWGRYSGQSTTFAPVPVALTQLLPEQTRRKMLSKSIKSGFSPNIYFGRWVQPSIAGQNDLLVLESMPMVDIRYGDIVNPSYADYHRFVQMPIFGQSTLPNPETLSELFHDGFVKHGGHDAKKYCTYNSKAYLSRSGVGVAGPRLMGKRKGRVVIGLLHEKSIPFQFGTTADEAKNDPYLIAPPSTPTILRWSDYGELLEQELYWNSVFPFTFLSCIAWEIWGED